MKTKELPKLTEAQIARFWSKVDRRGPDECWLWNGSVNERGYGVYGKGAYRVHRIAFVLSNALEPNQHVLHRCDVPRCCNPDHLFAGTHKDNMQDAIAKGRITPFSSPPMQRLTKTDVAQIRLLYDETELTQTDLAAMYDVSQGTIWQIVHRQTWA